MNGPSLNFPPFTPESRLLLGAGPSMVDPRVLAASAFPTLSHLDPRFVEMAHRMQDLLRHAFQTRNPLTFPAAGTGSAAMETAFANLVEPGDPVLVFTNGYFGGRMAAMAEKYGGLVTQMTVDWGEVFTIEQIEASILEADPKVVAIVHAETSTGAAQPMDGIADRVHANGGCLIVDAVTSLGGMPLLVDEWGIDICYSGTQKCLGAPPGLGPMTVSERALEAIRKRKTPVQSWYFDLDLLDQSWGPQRTYPHTAPVNAIYGLYEALRILHEEGLENCWQRHRRNTAALREGLAALRLERFVQDPAHRLPMITSVAVPEGIDAEAVRSQLSADHGIEIAAGLGPLKGRIWRIGLMGYASQAEHVDLILGALEEVLQEKAVLRSSEKS